MSGVPHQREIENVGITPGVGRCWYVAQTHPKAEGRAVFHLLRQGFDTYLPRYLKRRRHARTTDMVPAPLFPRYLFVAIDMAAQRWRSIHSTSGVSRLVCNGEVPARVASSVVDHLKGSEGEGGFIRLPAKPHFRPGDQIRVLDGVFSSCLGLFEGMNDGERVAVLLDLLGRKVRVVIGANSIAAA